ncbi:MAG: hypothetical protein U0T75_17170, partial [Chitinophagales bacterium]
KFIGMKYTIYLLLLSSVLLIPSCRKPGAVSEDYFGYWEVTGSCDISHMIIYDDGQGCYHEGNYSHSYTCNYDACGNILVGPIFFYVGKLKFKILEPIHRVNTPYFNYSGYYEMRLKKPSSIGDAELTLRKYFI